ncbi:hypothetical protein ANN_13509 [Periplaneta americana]|uniref:Uncharacterized protein n=1 Tax=Periplaneta americana TaxID=6978 RepID=A0ABQ8TL26_PERAM|nr:hypothetical protein ANN_13509 [Periplaneta americana]
MLRSSSPVAARSRPYNGASPKYGKETEMMMMMMMMKEGKCNYGGEMNPRSKAESYSSFNWLMINLKNNLNQEVCPNLDFNPSPLVSRGICCKEAGLYSRTGVPWISFAMTGSPKQATLHAEEQGASDRITWGLSGVLEQTTVHVLTPRVAATTTNPQDKTQRLHKDTKSTSDRFTVESSRSLAPFDEDVRWKLNLIRKLCDSEWRCEEYNACSSVLCNFLHSPVTSSRLEPNIFLSTLFSNTLNLCSSLRVRVQVSQKNRPKLSALELEAWDTFVLVSTRFLGNYRADNYAELVYNMLRAFQNLGCRMSLKMHVLHSHLDFFPSNLGAVSDEHAANIILENPKLTSDLAIIKANFGKLPVFITKLGTRSIPLHSAVQVMKKVETILKEIPGSVGETIRNKYLKIVERNPGWEQVLLLIGNDIDITAFPLVWSPAGIESLKYCPITSCEVERSFSQFKNILIDNRHQFSLQHLQEYSVIHCHNGITINISALLNAYFVRDRAYLHVFRTEPIRGKCEIPHSVFPT